MVTVSYLSVVPAGVTVGFSDGTSSGHYYVPCEVLAGTLALAEYAETEKGAALQKYLGSSSALRPLPPASTPPEMTWVACELCSKWRRIGLRAANQLPLRFTCQENPDVERSWCEVPQDLSDEAIDKQLGIEPPLLLPPRRHVPPPTMPKRVRRPTRKAVVLPQPSDEAIEEQRLGIGPLPSDDSLDVQLQLQLNEAMGDEQLSDAGIDEQLSIKPAMGGASAAGKKKRAVRCGGCAGCKTLQDCNACLNCLDRPRSCDPGSKRQARIERACAIDK